MKSRSKIFPSLAGTAAALLLFTHGACGGEVEIIRDNWGVPHIYADSQADAGFGLGYAQAEDGVQPILQYVMQARGQAARLSASRQAIEQDVLVRAFRVPEISETIYQATPAEVRAVLDAYAAGINRYLEKHPEAKPAWFDRMTGLDEMRLLKWFQFNQEWAIARQDLSGISQQSRDTDQASPPAGASNMWVVGPKKSSHGEVMLLSDPHLPWDGVTRWHEYQLTIGNRWIYGAGFFGFANVGIGFTPDVAWGATNNAADTADIYREKLNPDNAGQYRYDGQWRNIETRSFEIEVKGRGKVQRKVRFTHHGPIVREDRARHVAYAARLAGLETVNLALLSSEYFEANDVHDIYRSNRRGDHFKWNRIAIDRHGNIAYFYFAATHQRDDRFDWRRPVDGSTKDTEWGPPIPWDKLPAMFNPPAGYIVNCNNNPYTDTPDSPIKPADFPRHLADQSLTLRPESRAYRATELIAAVPKLNFQDMERISMDVKAVAAEPYIRLILAAYRKAGSPEGDVKRAVEILRDWDRMATIDNKATPILTTFVEVAGNIGRVRRESPGRILENLKKALGIMRQRWGAIEVRQGDVHVSKRGRQILPLAGAGNERAANPFVTLFMTGADHREGKQWVATRGSSWMMLVKYDQGKVEAETLLPWGVSRNPDSPHSADQARLFSKRQYKKALLSRQEVEAAASARLVLRR